MFFSRKRKKILLDKNIIKKNNVPILIKDKSWRDVFATKSNKSITISSKQLEELLLEQIRCMKTLEEKKKLKRELTAKILVMSDKINTKGAEDSIDELLKYKEDFAKVAEELEELYKKLEEYPAAIEALNRDLLEETVQIAYEDLLEGQKELDEIHKEIEKLRERLNVLRENKEGLDNKLSYLYSYLHTMIGHEEIEKLDIHYFKKEEE
ncbi:coiled-coil domain-containing protein [Alkaliphilus hydrothermalis]|uniref:DNA repair ATPase RecN n=1 Tax=Alkaliphilus hydrothermalis TaxID=1482730 RepID=A0ABS2NMT6_9FIRM|nr:hypothetical protein [Alkaliphilus hydrothermalis]MBM7614265.1 DNA repair ATPase RecN [Alkaliphilus hydrothermalis]